MRIKSFDRVTDTLANGAQSAPIDLDFRSELARRELYVTFTASRNLKTLVTMGRPGDELAALPHSFPDRVVKDGATTDPGSVTLVYLLNPATPIVRIQVDNDTGGSATYTIDTGARA